MYWHYKCIDLYYVRIHFMLLVLQCKILAFGSIKNKHSLMRQIGMIAHSLGFNKEIEVHCSSKFNHSFSLAETCQQGVRLFIDQLHKPSEETDAEVQGV